MDTIFFIIEFQYSIIVLSLICDEFYWNIQYFCEINFCQNSLFLTKISFAKNNVNFGRIHCKSKIGRYFEKHFKLYFKS